MKKIFAHLLFLTISALSFGQSSITGIIKDKVSGEFLTGATVMIQGTQLGAIADFDGVYTIEGVPNGAHQLVVKFLGFKEIITPVTVNGTNITLNIDLESDAQVLQGVMIVGKADRNTVSALTKLQQKSPAMLTGITSQEISKTPDRNTGDVLKRVSGTTVQDNKFVVIRGLADRYNTALINGLALPSSEPDKRAFSFDLFPASMMSNLVIYKTASPDLPGEFAGGVIELNTRDVPEEPFFQISLGGIHNSISTFKNYSFYNGSKTDWLGYDNSYRTLPAGVSKTTLTGAERFNTSKLIQNDWGVNNLSSMAPSYNVQLSAGTTKDVFGRSLGIIGSLGYSTNNRFYTQRIADFDIDTTVKRYTFYDKNFRKDAALGGLLNMAYKLSENSKISFNNILSLKGEDQYIERTGNEWELEAANQSYAMWYKSTKLLSSQLKGEHQLNGNGLKLKWGVSANDISRNTPSFRRMTYRKNFDSENSDPFVAFIPSGAPSPNYAGRFYSEQNERMYSANSDLSIPYFIKGLKSNLKFGAFGETRDRSFDARVLGYTIANISKFDQSIYTKPIGEIFDHANIGETGLVLKESTNPNDSYDASSTLAGGFIMTEHNFTDKFKAVGGLRIENYRQVLETFSYGGQPVNIDETTTDYLPSVNLVYAMNEKTNLRFSASQTVTRPNFRELAPFSFYDFALSAAVVGNPDLVRTKITNLDLKYELFPEGNQSFSFTTFYKHFNNPIEQFYQTLGSGTVNFNFANAKTAMNLGGELEFRYKLDNLISFANNVTVFGNLAYIYSRVDVSVDAASSINATERALQGQSPYILNGGISYTSPNGLLGFSLLYNKIGRRIWLVGSNQYLDTYEAPRNIIDAQITARIFKNGELKINIQDLLNNPANFYQDQNNSGKYDDGDTLKLRTVTGTNIGLSFTYKF